MTDNVVLIYFTAPDAQAAETIANALVEQHFAACVNIFPEGRSIYRWEGAVERTSEVVCIAKTTEATAVAVREEILNQHPYDTPCILALPVEGSLSAAPFLSWINENTKG